MRLHVMSMQKSPVYAFMRTSLRRRVECGSLCRILYRRPRDFRMNDIVSDVPADPDTVSEASEISVDSATMTVLTERRTLRPISTGYCSFHFSYGVVRVLKQQSKTTIFT